MLRNKVFTRIAGARIYLFSELLELSQLILYETFVLRICQDADVKLRKIVQMAFIIVVTWEWLLR